MTVGLLNRPYTNPMAQQGGMGQNAGASWMPQGGFGNLAAGLGGMPQGAGQPPQAGAGQGFGGFQMPGYGRQAGIDRMAAQQAQQAAQQQAAQQQQQQQQQQVQQQVQAGGGQSGWIEQNDQGYGMYNQGSSVGDKIWLQYPSFAPGGSRWQLVASPGHAGYERGSGNFVPKSLDKYIEIQDRAPWWDTK